MKRLHEGGHKAGCGCGFCKNKGNIHKRGKDKEGGEEKDEKKPTAESIVNTMLDEDGN